MTAPAVGRQEARDYMIAGLRVRSVIQLPAPISPLHTEEADVTVAEGTVSGIEVDVLGTRPMVAGDEGDLRLLWPDVVSMRVAAGRTITLQRAGDVEAAAVAPLVLGIGMGLLLHQRGRLVLHASAVALAGGAVAFVGWKGAGKSTAAGALVARGHSIVTDDALPLDAEGEGRPLAWPGPAPLKLWPESAAALGRPPRRLQRLHPKASKRVVADVPQTAGPVPLLAIYALDVGAHVAIEIIEGQAALLEIMRHAYAPRFLPASGATPAHFGRCARVARAVPVFRLSRPPALDALGEVAAAVEAHAATLGGEA